MILINGEQADRISVTDRGLQYGDGVFETISIVQDHPRLLENHLQRLKSACKRLQITYPGDDLLKEELSRVCSSDHPLVVKIILTRGQGGRGYKPSADATVVTRILSTHPWPQYPSGWYEEGIRLRICQQTLSRNPALAGIKHLNRLEQVLASMEWDDPDIAEGIMLDTENNVIEGTKTNLFMIRDNEITTADLGQSGVKGIMRELLIKLARDAGLKVFERNLQLEDLYTADEMLVCNSVVGIWPVKQLEQHTFSNNRPVCDILVSQLATQPGFAYPISNQESA